MSNAQALLDPPPTVPELSSADVQQLLDALQAYNDTLSVCDFAYAPVHYHEYNPAAQYQSSTSHKPKPPSDAGDEDFVTVRPQDLKSLAHIDSSDLHAVGIGSDIEELAEDSDEEEEDSIEVDDIQRHLWVGGDIKYK